MRRAAQSRVSLVAEMPKPRSITRDAYLNIRLPKRVKDLAERGAAKDCRSVTSYIEKLIIEAAGREKV